MSFCDVTLQQYTLGIRKGAGLAGLGGPGRAGSWCANVPSYILSTTDRGNDLALDDDVSLYEERLLMQSCGP
jgi:hypothetical protein